MVSAYSRSTVPGFVGVILGDLVSSVLPISVSNFLICWLTADWVLNSRFAAVVKFWVSSTVLNVSRSVSSIVISNSNDTY